QVTLSVLERDLAQVVDVRVRDEFGDPLPPLRLRAGGEHQLLELVRAGAGGDQRLRRTAWQITERGLERRLWPGVDIVDPESMRVRPFADLVAEDQRLGMDSAFHFIVRTQAGLDRGDAWPPAEAEPGAAGWPSAVGLGMDIPGPGVDIVDPESMRVRPFADLVAEDQRLGMDSAFHFIVRTQAGLDRVDAWPPADADPEAGGLPMAVELVLDIPGLGEIRRLMAV